MKVINTVAEYNEAHKVLWWLCLKPEYGGYRGPNAEQCRKDVLESIEDFERRYPNKIKEG